MLHSALLRLWAALVRKLGDWCHGGKTVRAARQLWFVLFTAVARRLGFKHEPPQSSPRSKLPPPTGATSTIVNSSASGPPIAPDGKHDTVSASSTPQEIYLPALSPAPSPSRLEEGLSDIIDEKELAAKSPETIPQDASPPPTSNDTSSDTRPLPGPPVNASLQNQLIIPVRPYNIEINRGDGYKYALDILHVS